MRIRAARFTRRGPVSGPRSPVVRRARRLHPRVDFAWDIERGAWSVIERTLQGNVALIAPLAAKPDMRAIDCLNVGSEARRMDRASYEAWADKCEEAHDQHVKDVEAETNDQINEGSERLWHALGTDTVVPMGGSNEPASGSEKPD